MKAFFWAYRHFDVDAVIMNAGEDGEISVRDNTRLDYVFASRGLHEKIMVRAMNRVHE